MPNCSSISCTNRSSDTNCTVSFHRLPITNRDSWLAKIRRDGGDKLTDLRICSNHFEKDCFERDLKAELLGTKPMARLKKNSIPTIFMFNTNTEKRKLSEARKENASKKQYVDEACCSIPQDEHVSDEHRPVEHMFPDNIEGLQKDDRSTQTEIEIHSVSTQTDISYVNNSYSNTQDNESFSSF